MTKSRSDKSAAAEEPTKINAMPTKQLFIGMLTRDIGLVPAIVDLIDNSVDGARALRTGGNYTGLWVRLNLSSKAFQISDNCGGMPVDVARDYAFRFGRAEGAPAVTHSIGQFGVGMKRAIFKMGNHFRVASTSESSRFVVAVDVTKWALDDAWEFAFSELDESLSVQDADRGTSIQITKLHHDVAETFAREHFASELSREIERRLQDPIDKGLMITVQGIPVTRRPLLLLADKQLAPATKSLTLRVPGKKAVLVQLYCGLGESDRAAAGWHVFCNGRLVLEADKTITTGWGEKGSGIDIPGFHNQYNHLRGYAFFDSEDAGALPWNTTKTGVDIESLVFRTVRLEMIKLMRPVVSALNQLKDEKQSTGDGADGLARLIATSDTVPFNAVRPRPVFSVPSLPARRVASHQRLSYDVPLDQATAAKKALKVSTWKEVGLGTFKYFVDNEVAE